MNQLRLALREYLTLRRDMGFKFQNEESRLAKFVTFMEERRAPMITHKLAIEWATQPAARHATWTLRLTDIRGFARYLQSIGVKTEIPPTVALPGLSRSKPYIYTEAEVRRLLAAALALPPRDALRRWTYYILLGLLAVTGLRILHRPPSSLDLQDLAAPTISAFLDDMEKRRSVSVRTRNLRLTAIRSFFRFIAFEELAYSALIQRVLAIPSKRHDKSWFTS